jgi:hypothetical protein
MSEVQTSAPENYPGPPEDLGSSLVHAEIAAPSSARSGFARGYIRACQGNWC